VRVVDERVHEVGKSGSLELGFGPDQYSGLVAAGLVGTLPTVTWMLWVGMPFAGVLDGVHLGSGRGGEVVTAVLGGVLGLALIVLPSVVPCLILRARQPHGARITWDDEGVIEWDGAWRRMGVPWKGMTAASTLGPAAELRTRGRREAIQLTGRSTDGCITVWDIAPEEAPVVRRRLCSSQVSQLKAAIEAHGVPFTQKPEWSLARDPDRARPKMNRIVGRFGYVAAVLAPLMAGPSRSLGIAVALVGAGLLAYRARPVLAELRAIKARIDTYDRGDANDMARHNALADKLRAARLEAFVRIACVLLTLLSTVGSAVGPWGGPGSRT
jgi:hypothetical protein